MSITDKVWSMLNNGESENEILKICSKSALCKIRAVYNKSSDKKNPPDKFPQKPRGKSNNKQNTPANFPIPGKPNIESKENFEKGEKSFNVKSYEVKTLEDLIKWCEVDLDIYEVQTFTSNVWGHPRYACTQAKAIFKKKVSKSLDPKEMSDIFKDMVSGFNPSVRRPVNVIGVDNMAIMPIADLHFGSQARIDEVGSNNDLDISRQILLNSVFFHLTSIEVHQPEEILIPLLGDFFNTDTTTNTTTRGTYQENASSWKNTFRKGCELMVEVIDICSRIAPVKVVICNGNHDLQNSHALGMFLEAWYRNVDNVIIDNSHSIRKYSSYGNSLFGFGHGDTKANADYLGIMCLEAEKLFVTSRYRTVFVGHLHHKTTEEKPGITVRRVGSLTSSDTWHKTKGYQSMRSSESYIVNKNKGIRSNSTFYLD